jgi:hypothetical protein
MNRSENTGAERWIRRVTQHLQRIAGDAWLLSAKPRFNRTSRTSTAKQLLGGAASAPLCWRGRLVGSGIALRKIAGDRLAAVHETVQQLRVADDRPIEDEVVKLPSNGT